MVMTRAYQESSKAYRDHEMGIMGFLEAAAEVLNPNNISDISIIINTRIHTYHNLTHANRVSFTTTEMEQVEAFKAWMRATELHTMDVVQQNGNQNSLLYLLTNRCWN